MKSMLPLFLLLVLLAPKTHAEEMKEFMVACTYGVLAGTLVGTATLAFTKKPGENLQSIARGASLGLYAGIFLGLYVINLNPDSEIEELEQQLEEGEEGEEYEDDVNPENISWKAPRLQNYPTLSADSGRWEGVAVNYRLLSW